MADIQPRTSPDPENNPPKKRGRPKGSKNKSATNTDSVAASKSKKSTKKRLTAQPDVPPVETLQETQASAVTELSVRIDWTTDRIDALINGITDNPEIKQGLFPSPETVAHDQYGNIVKANSKPKTEYNWKLAKVVFEFDEDYADVFMSTTGATAGQNYWAGKIKNKLEEMIGKVNKYKNEMGETGAGLTSAEQIDMSLTNGFTTKWAMLTYPTASAQIREDCPYFFEVRNLLGERPNQTPVGLGNGGTINDTTYLLDGLTKSVDTSDGEGSISEGSDEEDEIEENDKSRKRPKVNDKKICGDLAQTLTGTAKGSMTKNVEKQLWLIVMLDLAQTLPDTGKLSMTKNVGRTYTLLVLPMADIQPRTSPDPENNPPKKRGRPKGSKNKSATNTDSVAASKSKKSTKKRLTAQPDVPPVETLQETQASAVTELSVRIDWTTDRIDALINGITDNPEIKQGLFPSPETVAHDQYGNIVKANSKPKTEYNWKLAKVVFEFDEDYADVFMSTTGATAGQNYWAGKIKNKLEEMIGKVNKYKNEMGETGAGLTSAEQIDMSLTNGFTTKWAMLTYPTASAQIREDCPYFFEVRNLLGERPNQTPVGLGNGGTINDTTYLLDGLTKSVDTSDGEGSISEGSDEEDEIEENDKSRKRPKVNDKKFGPKRGKSTPATSNIKVARKGKQTAVDRFVEIEKEAEQTDRERLRNQRTKARHESDLAVAKVQAKAQVKVAQSKAKMDFALAKRQMEMDHEYRMKSLETGNSKESGGSKGRNTYGSGPLLNEWMPTWEASQNDALSSSSPLFSGGDNMPFLGGDTDDTLYHNKDI
ncbi:hypothetical protein K435DRAFT_811066 [Dendrothele bispora CBS 962.96]|uniref:Uncharacterized protein n=1 Tax=Dendrothele bispora (strain CBS 962.96) TaxID=1314807 RepID=A0A4S8KT57_DENBC|nr:hypothetical protein K435DRAFT_811066 [Dendrothele bispora CBS 962.96]